MIENPTIDLTVETRVQETFTYPFHITCVVPYVDEIGTHPMFHTVKQFCLENKIGFSAREYNSLRYEEDCSHIYRMPAFHFYGKKGRVHWDTYFTNDNVIQKIRNEMVMYQQKQERKQKRKEQWNKRVGQLIHFFEGLGKKKPKMVVPERPKAKPAAVPVQFPECNVPTIPE